MKPEEYEILDLIPQRPPMVMIDRLIHAGENIARGRLFLEPSNLFCCDGCLQEAGMIEFITQTAAAWKGYLRLSEQKEVKPGFLASIKNLVIKSLPAAGTEIQSEIMTEEEVLGYIIINGKVLQNNIVIAEGEMRILMET
ncbi:MAG: hydroxymyristoyl-ACP dehydratase [Bacteroidales bacterium]|nr:hydroxymyristoyl-ACP dehydratase [Bacteroidales bacterium]